jgi:hypothetical protein
MNNGYVENGRNESSSEDGLRQVTLVKSGERYVFRYAPGGEKRVLHELSEMVMDPNCGVGLLDAAVICHQMGQRMDFSGQSERE